MAKTITRIPASVNLYTAQPINQPAKRRVAGYARVSTDTEEQASSYEAQMDYYTNYINSREDWMFVGMYSDEGISATNTKRREGFNQMVEDALAGKIDLIITKSVSRFARNTVDSLTTVRELKEKGVEIYFEKENIWTLDAKGELLITIMSSLAQEESRSISENTTWGLRKQFADGKASVGFKRFLGYDRGPDGEFVINEEQAVTVRYIYKRYMEGYSTYRIAQELTEKGIKSPAGNDKWNPSCVNSILRNEKYKGDALLQKKFTKDFLTHKMVVNNGEVPQYYVEGHHEGIVTAEQYDQVQAELLRRRSMQKYSGVGVFSSRIKCGECGSWYGPAVFHSTDKYRKVVFRCTHKYKNGYICRTPNLTEGEIKELFIKAANILFSEKKEILANAKEMMEMVCDTAGLEKEQADYRTEINIISEQMQNAIMENSRVALDQDEYAKRCDALKRRYDAAKEKYDGITKEIEGKKAKRALFKLFIGTLEKRRKTIEEFDEGLWCSLIDHVTVKSKEEIVFTFRNGLEITP
jgi:DNA invertase Pin-like site-specific DNA recombinase